MKKLLIIPGIILVVFLIFGLTVFLRIRKNTNDVLNTEIHDFNLQTINNGTYTGEYYVEEEMGATLEVTIQNHTITNIVILEHKHGKGEPAEIIINDVIEEQSLDVDDISGATISSRMLLLSIEDALKEE